MKLGARKALGLQSLDTLTDAEFRGQGLFVKLATEMFERTAPAQRVEAVYGFPNGNSAHGFFERLGWSRLDPVPFMMKPLRTSYLAKRVLRHAAVAKLLPNLPLSRGRPARLARGQELRTVTTFDAEYDDLWQRFSPTITAGVWRDAAYLNWRLRRPSASYRTLALYDAGRLAGFVVFSSDGHGEGTHGHIVELMFDPSQPAWGQTLLRAAIHELVRDGVDVALCWNLPGSPNHGTFLRSGFFRVPERFWPIELHFGWRSLTSTASSALVSRRGWYVSYLDNDTR
jgi:ribosomal protein S18 acetylase RimI-like enzyme